MSSMMNCFPASCMRHNSIRHLDDDAGWVEIVKICHNPNVIAMTIKFRPGIEQFG